jgi:hypothetical protein
MLNTTETQTLALEFDAVLTAQRRHGLSSRFGLSMLYSLRRRDNGAIVAGPCESENALEKVCRLLNTVLHQKKECPSAGLGSRPRVVYATTFLRNALTDLHTPLVHRVENAG